MSWHAAQIYVFVKEVLKYLWQNITLENGPRSKLINLNFDIRIGPPRPIDRGVLGYGY